ncbi:zinc finger protein 888-like isoform X2 [Armigeres subalbatus]|uniref:zinc finger protein 888-like isoform X2 n=1 Tax=Armigeres subalbatus TaxID=124917 RepID=UPI002ED19679
MDLTATLAAPQIVQQVCRLCLSEENLEDIKARPDLQQWISDYLSITVSLGDNISLSICFSCRMRVKEFHVFQLRCREVQDILTASLSAVKQVWFNCKDCDKMFQSKKKLQDHLRIHKGKKYNCSHCGKGFIRPSSLAEHLRVHTSRNVYQNDAGKEPELTTNSEHVSCGEIEFACGKYHRGLKYKKQLKNHISGGSNVSLSKGIWFDCDYCEKVFPSKKKLQDHLRIHRRKKYKCSYCDKGFIRPSGLAEHVKIHTKEYKSGKQDWSVAKFACGICDRKFKYEQQLKNHLRHDHGPKGYKCSVCNEAFRTERQMRTHSATHNKLISESYIKESSQSYNENNNEGLVCCTLARCL